MLDATGDPTQDPPIFTRVKEKLMNDERANDVQDPAEPKQVDTSVETTPQPEPADAQESVVEVKNTDVAPGSTGVTAGLGARPTANEELAAQQEASDRAESVVQDDSNPNDDN